MPDQTLNEYIEELSKIEEKLEIGKKLNPDPFSKERILFN